LRIPSGRFLTDRHGPFLVESAQGSSRAPFDFGYILVAEFKVGSDDDGINLVGPTEANDGTVDGRVAQGPGAGDGTRRGVVTVCHRRQTFDELEVLRQLWLQKARIASPPVVGGHALDPIRSWVILPVNRPDPIGEYTITPISSWIANGRSSASMSRSISEYCGWSVSNGAICWI
jgi:hypothetical protein